MASRELELHNLRHVKEMKDVTPLRDTFTEIHDVKLESPFRPGRSREVDLQVRTYTCTYKVPPQANNHCIPFICGRSARVSHSPAQFGNLGSRTGGTRRVPYT